MMADAAPSTDITLFRNSPMVRADALWKLHNMPTLFGMIEKSWPGDRKPSERKERTAALIQQAIVHITNANPAVREKILRCTGDSVLQSLSDTAALDLTLHKATGEVYLVPYGACCTAMVGYQGFIKLIMRTGSVASLTVHAVYEGEHFKPYAGTDPRIEHEVRVDVDRADSKIIAVYTVVHHLQGPPSATYMNRDEINRVRAASKAKDGPWKYWYGEMAKKSVIRRGRKTIPLRTDQMPGQILLRALDMDNRDFGLIQGEATEASRQFGRNLHARAMAQYRVEVVPDEEPPTDGAAATDGELMDGAGDKGSATDAAPAPPPSPDSATLAKFLARVANKRGDDSTLSHADFVQAVVESEIGVDHSLGDLITAEYEQVDKALHEGRYAWDNAQRVPD